MPSATITVESVQRVEGVSKASQKPYTKYVIHAANGGGEFATFDGALANTVYTTLIGKRAVVEYEDGRFGKDLKAITALPDDAPGQEDFRAVTSEGAPDWDVKDLRINRCAFWKEILGPAMQAGMGLLHENATAADVAGLVHSLGTTLRQIAEADIYSDKKPAGADDWLPF